MLCNRCGLRKAIVSYVTFGETEKEEIHLCKECMEQKLKEDIQTGKFFDDNMIGLIESMLHFFNTGEKAGKNIVCSKCGTTWDEFQKTGILGCNQCYEDFQELLTPLIKNMQGSNIHQGKVSVSADELVQKERELDDLRRELKRAVETEEYERAAVLRDEINDILELKVGNEGE